MKKLKRFFLNYLYLIIRYVKKIPTRVFFLIIIFALLFLVLTWKMPVLENIKIWNIDEYVKIYNNLGITETFKHLFTFIDILIIIGLLLFRFCNLKEKAIIICQTGYSKTMATYDSEIKEKFIIKDVITIDQTNELQLKNYKAALKKQQNAFSKPIVNHIIYYGISATPLIFKLGFDLQASTNVLLLHKKRDNNSLFEILPTTSDSYFRITSFLTTQNEVDSREMLVTISTTFSIKEDEVGNLKKGKYLILNFYPDNNCSYGFDILNSQKIQNEAKKYIFDTILDLSKKHNIKHIHIAMSTSSDFTFFLGQSFASPYFPNITVYQYDRNSEVYYPWGINMNENDPEKAIVIIPK